MYRFFLHYFFTMNNECEVQLVDYVLSRVESQADVLLIVVHVIDRVHMEIHAITLCCADD